MLIHSMEKADDNADTHVDDKNEIIHGTNEKAYDTIIQKKNHTTSTLEVIENQPAAMKIKKATLQLSKDEEKNEVEKNICLSTPPEDAIANIHERKNSIKISSSEVISKNKLMGEDAEKSFGLEQTDAPDGEQNIVVDIRATLSMKDCMASVFADGNIMNPANCQFQEETPSKVDLINLKCHNLSISELRRKLAFCPICQIQYSNHKLANMCLAKHGKRQCWLCLDILSSKKDDFYKHCIEYHQSISKNGDIVGCPFCGKYFDFRQGLNQHIVKIHFAESISDLEAVASLSPSTLVDIFTGKPRTSSSSSEDIQSQHPQCQNDYHGPLADTLSGAERDQYDPINISMECPNVETSLSISPETQQSQQQSQQQQPRSSCTRLSSFSRSFSKTPDILQSCSDTIANFSRPSVIALLGHTMQRMSVPPEQTLSSLIVDEIEHRSSESVQKQNSALDQLENNVKIVENSCLQKSMAEDLIYSKSARLPSMQMRVAPNPEKYDTISYSDLPVHNDSRVSTTNTTTSSYEQQIRRVSNVFQQQTQNQSLASQSFIDIGSNNGPAATSNSHLDANDIFSDVNKGYHNSIGSMLKTVSDFEFNDQSVVNNSAGLLSPIGALGNQIDSTSFPCTTDCQKTGRETCLNQEIALNNCGAPKFPDNCGVKRRILMKAMWDEHQFKKPSHTHALVHDLNTATSLLAPPSSHKSLNPRVATFSRGYQDNLITNGGRHQLKNTPQMLTANREPKKDAGPFFEQYVREDRKRQGAPFKLLDLARATDQAHKKAALNTLNSLSSASTSTSGGQVYNSYDYLKDTSSCAVNSSLQSNSLQCVASNFPRGQIPSNSNYLRGRRPSNPAFWDGLRARLTGSQNMRQTNPGGCNPCRPTFQNPTSYFDCRYSGQQAVENIIVQNPFEEDTSFIQRSLSTKTLFGNNDSRNQVGCCRVAVATEIGPSQDNDQLVFGVGIGDAPTFMNRYSSAAMRHHPYAKSIPTSTYTSAQQASNGCDSTMANMMAFTQFCTETSSPGKDAAHNNNTYIVTPQANLQPKYCEAVAQDDFQTNFGQPLFIAPRYAEQYHHILNRLHNMDKSKLCK